MPGTAASLGCNSRITWSAESFRCARGLSRRIMRPWLDEPACPPWPEPTDDMNSTTFGS